MSVPKRIIGEGMIAKAMRSLPDNDITVFASGVSNSTEVEEKEYDREFNLLKTSINDSRMIYFSSYTAKDGLSRYSEHKRNMENFILQNCERYIVLRLPQVVGLTMNMTLVNCFVRAVESGELLHIQRHAYRSLVDIDDVVRVLGILLSKNTTNCLMSLGPRNPISVLSIVYRIEEILNKKMNYDVIDGGSHQEADLSYMSSILPDNDILLHEDYQFLVLDKYVPLLYGRRNAFTV